MNLSKIKSHLGLLLILPIFSLLLLSEWDFNCRIIPTNFKVINGEQNTVIETKDPTSFWLFRDGARWDRAIILLNKNFLKVELPKPVKSFTLELQGDFNEKFAVSASSDGTNYFPLWEADKAAGDSTKIRGLRTRSSRLITTDSPVQYFKIIPTEGDGYSSVSWFSVEEKLFTLPKYTSLIPWLLFSLLIILSKLPYIKTLIGYIFRFLTKFDIILSLITICFLLSQTNFVAFTLFFLFSILYISLKIIKNTHFIITLTFIIILIAGFFYSQKNIIRNANLFLGKFYDLNVDQRILPFGQKYINSDGVKFQGEATDIKPTDFPILLLGDSYAYGYRVDYDKSFAMQIEQKLSGKCSQPVKIVNLAWVGASPILSLRYIKAIAAKYNPKLVLYSFDMTDFSEDLKFEKELQDQNDLELDYQDVTYRMIKMFIPWLNPKYDQDISTLFNILKLQEDKKQEKVNKQKHGELFFATKYPLNETRGEFEDGVINSLNQIYEYSTSVLDAKMLLVLTPRAYQYTKEESPKNYEKDSYEVLGPNVKEPFRFFKEREKTLPYPILNLLEFFENSKEFPLYLEDDPHWTPKGHTLAADTIVNYIVKNNLAPCSLNQ